MCVCVYVCVCACVCRYVCKYTHTLESEEVGSNASKRMDLLSKRKQEGKEQKLLSSMPLRRLPAEGVAGIKSVSSHLKIQFRSISFFFKLSKKKKRINK